MVWKDRGEAPEVRGVWGPKITRQESGWVLVDVCGCVWGGGTWMD